MRRCVNAQGNSDAMGDPVERAQLEQNAEQYVETVAESHAEQETEGDTERVVEQISKVVTYSKLKQQAGCPWNRSH